MGNSQSAGPRGLHAPHVYAGVQGPQGPYLGPPGPHLMRPGGPRGPPVRWPRLEPPIKVLPQLPPPIALRNTPNGTILQQGGTISARPQSAGPQPGRRPRSSSAHRPPEPESPDLTRCGSEPDLRAQTNGARRDPRHHHMTRGRKKYRAPPAPHPAAATQSGMESSSPDLNGWEAAPRKARLFKTRAETNRRGGAAAGAGGEHCLSLPRPDLRDDSWQHRPELREEARSRLGRSESREEQRSRHSRSESREETKNRRNDVDEVDKGGWTSRKQDAVSLPRVDAKENRRSLKEDQSTSLQRSRSQDALSAKALATPEFQAELVEVAEKLRPRSALIPRHDNSQGTDSPELPIQQVLRPLHQQQLAKENAQPAKTFYFGMEESNKTVIKDINTNVNKTNREHRLTAVEKSKNLMNKRQRNKEADDEMLLENFAATYHRRQQHSVSGTSSMGSDPDPEEVEGIALQLRPTLPKKQLEIPRFSPTAAWRMLSSVDVSPAASPDSGRGMLEERIMVQECAQLSLDKSADSGISGDASPGGGHESSSELVDIPPKTIHYNLQSQKSLLLAWTPEQDLEESSSEEEPPSQSKLTAVPGAKLTTRFQLFSTLPRERLEDTAQDSGSLFNSLRRPTSQPSDSNWLLSRSVPGSLNNGHATLVRSTSSPPSPEQLLDDLPVMTKYPSYSYLAQGGHVVYLPEYSLAGYPDRSSPSSPFPAHKLTTNPLSRSCEDLCADMQQPSPEDQWQLKSDNASRAMTEQRPQKKKKFTFQSTVRIIENKRLAEKLSREAEYKETQRLSELEAMRRVEEEFQRKRAREKANIRHQLRLFSLEEKDFQSLPPLDWGRAEPDGAPASLPSVAPAPPASRPGGAATQVLSEYRETTRDYRDYPHQSRNSPDLRLHPLEVQTRKNIVKHPRIVADIPKNLPVYVSAQQSTGAPSPRPRDNYRKEFAHGALPSQARAHSSDSESQPRTRPASRTQGQQPSRTRLSPTFHRESRSQSASPDRCRASRSSSPSPPRNGLTRPDSRTSSSHSPEPSRSATPRAATFQSRNSKPEQVSVSPPPLVQPWSERSRITHSLPSDTSHHGPVTTSPVIDISPAVVREISPCRIKVESPSKASPIGWDESIWGPNYADEPRAVKLVQTLTRDGINNWKSEDLNNTSNETRRSRSTSPCRIVHIFPKIPQRDSGAIEGLMTKESHDWADIEEREGSVMPSDSQKARPRDSRSPEATTGGRRSRSSSPHRRRSGSSNKSQHLPRSRSSSPPGDSFIQNQPMPPPRILLSAVQPFNKTGKSYRPINFTPNVAQVVT